MDKLTIFLSDGNWDGPVTMDSPSSMFKVIRVKKVDLSIYEHDMSLPGIYFLLIGTDSVYVGQTSDSIYKRILNTHSGEIDKLWHTVAAFPFRNKIISNNSLLYLENAMCEFAHKNYTHCLTTSPAKSNCNLKYRNKNYSLSGNDILTCGQYIEDIQYYITSFKEGSLFAGTAIVTPSPTSASTVEGPSVPATLPIITADVCLLGMSFYLSSKKKDVHSTGTILEGNRILVKKGSTIAKESRLPFQQRQVGMESLRQKLIDDGTIKDFVFTKDWEFNSPSTAATVILGASTSGNAAWKDENGTCLGNFIKN